VLWTAYPSAFGSIASTLSVPLFIAAIGIILRGAAYALRSGTRTRKELRTIDTTFALSSILTPFALGAVVGGIASGRVPVGNAAGRLYSSWTGPTSIMIGALAVASAAYLAAVFLSADAVRLAAPDLEQAFRARAIIAGLVAGALAISGLIVIHSDAHRLYHHLVSGAGLPALIASVLAGVAALVLVWKRRYELARFTAATAVAAIIAGWALAQRPTLIAGLTIGQAAAPHDTLVLVIVVVLAGGAILLPSLALLFILALRGRLHLGADAAPSSLPALRSIVTAARTGLLARSALGCLIAGFGLLTVGNAEWAHAIGVVSLLGFVGLGFAAIAPAALASAEPEDRNH
jgi:cytochrome d ubiquinol oxidase subunit II